MNVIRLILDFLFYRWLADKTSARDIIDKQQYLNSPPGRRVEILLFINNYKGLAKLELLDISKRVGFLLHLITVYLRNSIINVNREKFMWIQFCRYRISHLLLFIKYLQNYLQIIKQRISLSCSLLVDNIHQQFLFMKLNLAL